MFFKHKTSVSSGLAVVFFVFAIVFSHASMALDLKQTDRDHPNMRDDVVGVSPDQQRQYLVRALKRGKDRLRFDVVELGTRFAFDEAPIDENGFPLYGNPFITQGVIYPAGVVEVNADGNTSGVIMDTDENGKPVARPEFPELVLGTWVCRGTVFADGGFNIETGPTVHTTQLFDFQDVSEGFGRLSITTSGLEFIDLNTPMQRAVVGGTGPYKRAHGEMEQTFVGVNASQGFSLRFETDLR